MAKRGENIYKRKDGRWEGRYIKGRNADKKIHYGYVYAGTYNAVKKKLTIKKATTFSAVNASERYYGTLSNWLDYWLDSIASKKVKLSTLDSYQSKVDCHIRPEIGDILLSDLKTADLSRFVEELREKVSISSLHAIFRVLKTALIQAEKLSFISRDLYERVEMPKMSKPHIETLTSLEHQRLAKEASKTSQGLPVLLSLETGMRIGEVSGLKWEDIDFINRTISVKRTLQRVKSRDDQYAKTRIIEERPKSDSSERVIPLSVNLCALLIEEKKRSKSCYVVSRRLKYTEPRLIRHYFRRLLQKLNLRRCSFHALRHSFATRCLEKGVNIAVISSLLGHASTKMTLDVYTGSDLTQERMAMEAVTAC